MVKTKPDICNTLCRKIEEALIPLIDSDYLFLDLPYYSNIGDALIWLGTEHFMENLPHNCLGEHSLDTFDFRPIPKSTVILLQGGGNFGDIWRQHQDFRLKVMQQYQENRIIVLPQTIHYESDAVLTRDVQQMNRHQHLTVCVRDSHSAAILQEKGFTGQLLMLPDMAFCIDREILLADKGNKKKQTLLLLRNDIESPLGGLREGTVSKHMDVKDWPHLNKSLRSALKYIREHTAQETDLYFQTIYLPERIREGVRFVSEYKMVYSTRLHVAILRLLLGMPVKMMNNSYGKNLTFYNTWLKDCDLVSTPEEGEQRALGMAIYVQQQEQKKMKRWKKIYAFILTFLLLAAMAIFLVSIPTQ